MRIKIVLILFSFFVFSSSSFSEDNENNLDNDAIKTKILRMAVFGNSISQGANAINMGANTQINWASGNEINSHAVKLEKEYDVNVIVKNVAEIGAPSHRLRHQLKELKLFIPDYATIEIGSNDLCRKIFNDDNIVKYVKRTIDALIHKNPNIKIVIAPIPKITSIYSSAPFTAKCILWWNISCPDLLGSFLSDNDRLLRQLKIDGINYSLLKLAEMYPEVYFNPELGYKDILRESISTLDCFHPSIEGQQKISDYTYPVGVFENFK